MKRLLTLGIVLFVLVSFMAYGKTVTSEETSSPAVAPPPPAPSSSPVAPEPQVIKLIVIEEGTVTVPPAGETTAGKTGTVTLQMGEDANKKIPVSQAWYEANKATIKGFNKQGELVTTDGSKWKIEGNTYTYYVGDGKKTKEVSFVVDKGILRTANFLTGETTLQKGDQSVTVPTTVYERYASMIDFSKEQSANKLVLQNDGSVEVKRDSSGLTTTTVVIKDTGGKEIKENSGTTWTTPSGICQTGCTSKDGWTLSGGTITHNEDNIEVTTTKQNNVITITEKNTKSKTEKEIVKDANGEVITKKKDGKPVSRQVWNAEGRLLAEVEEFDGNNVKEFHLFDQRGRIQAVCYGSACDGKAENSNNIWVTNDRFCSGSKSTCFDDQGNPKPTWQSEDACQDATCAAISSKEQESFWRGETTPQRVIGSILALRPGWEGLSAWWAPDRTRKWQKDASETFDKLLLAEYVAPALLCEYDAKHQVKREGESAVFIEVQPGIVQLVGSIQAERTENKEPILCDEEFPCREGGEREQECREGVCYLGDKVVEGYFYKITWGVSAPKDESFTPFIDENGVAVKYNVELRRGGSHALWLYPAEGSGDSSTLTLTNGASDRDAYVAYSDQLYDQACVIFSAPPKDLEGNEVREMCASFKTSGVGQVEWEKSGKSSSQGSTKVEEVGRKQI